MAVYILPEDSGGQIIAFDATTGETHESYLEVTEHAIETGATITDHTRLSPERVTITGYVSNTPIYVNPLTGRGETRTFKLTIPQWEPPIEATPGSLYRAGLNALGGLLFGKPEYSATVLYFPDPFDAIRETYEALVDLQKRGALVRVLTSIREYESQIIERVSLPRSNTQGTMAEFAVECRALKIVNSGTTISAPIPEEPRGAPQKKLGAQPAEPSFQDSEDSDSASIFYSVIDTLRSGL